MNNLQLLKRENKYLQKEIYLALSNKRIPQNDSKTLRENFIKNFYKILKLSFDILVTREGLEKTALRGVIRNHPKNLLFIAKTIENQKTYELLNTYLNSYLNIINKYTNTL